MKTKSGLITVDYAKELNRQDWLCDIVEFISRCGLNSYYNITYKNTERLLPLKDQGFVLLPKHQHKIDILLEGTLLKTVLGRHGYYLMKDELPKRYKWLGGFQVIRFKDFEEAYEEKVAKLDLEKVDYAYLREIKKKLNSEAKLVRDDTRGKMEYILRKGEILVVHSEGTRNFQEMGIIERPLLISLMKIQKKIGKPTTFVPLDFEYQYNYRSRFDIVVTVGDPIQTSDYKTLEQHLVNNIKLISSKPLQ